MRSRNRSVAQRGGVLASWIAAMCVLALVGCSDGGPSEDASLRAEGAPAETGDSGAPGTADGQVADAVTDAGVRARLTIVYTNNVDGEIEPCG